MLTATEREIIRRARLGQNRKTMAAELGVSLSTIRNHYLAIFKKCHRVPKAVKIENCL